MVDAFADNGGRYNALRLLRADDGSPFRPEEFLNDPIGREWRPVVRDFLTVGRAVPPGCVRIAQGVVPPNAGVQSPCRIERWSEGWRIDLPGTVARWEAMPLWAAAFLDGRVFEPPVPA